MSLFNPQNCQWASMPFVVKPNCGPWDSGSHVGYLQGVLKCKANNSSWNPPAAPIAAPYWYDGATYNGVIAIQLWYNAAGWNLPVDGRMSQTMWWIVDYLATH